jgi:hypothetical protein
VKNFCAAFIQDSQLRYKHKKHVLNVSFANPPTTTPKFRKRGGLIACRPRESSEARRSSLYRAIKIGYLSPINQEIKPQP